MNTNIKLHSFSIVRQSKDFYSATIRFVLGLFIALYVWVGMSNGEFIISQYEYNTFASFFFIMTIFFGIDIFRNPNSIIRRYCTLFFDFSCTTYAITLTGYGNSQFILIYIWLYIAYGTRYGSNFLVAAVGLVLVEFNVVLIIGNTWATNILGSSAQNFVLTAMPLYLHSMLRQLREAKRVAELATHAKSNFLATMSHEIRTPMNGIIGTAHLLQRTNQNKEQKEYTEALLDASKSLHALIDDILDFSKIEANKLNLQKTPFDLYHTINEVVAVLSPSADYHSLEMIVYIDPKLPTLVVGDSQRIRQILFNLLGNAIKFTEKGEIILKVTELCPSKSKNDEVNLRFDVIDTGIGMDNEQQKHIFDRFTQANNQHTYKFGGTGLGTTISKQLVECMGGEIGLKSSPGDGSHFWFTITLPIDKDNEIKDHYYQQFSDRRVALLIANDTFYQTLENYCHYFGFNIERFDSNSALVNGLQHSVKHNQPFELVMLSYEQNKNIPVSLANEINALDYGPYSVPKKLFLNPLSKRSETQKLDTKLFDRYITTPVNFKRLGNTLLELLNIENIQINKISCCDLGHISLQILIAEDEDINAMVLSSFLQDAGHKTTRVLNGIQAVEELSKNTYDIAFMDMRMPEMNGIDATVHWRQQEPEDSHIPIIALTANATREDKEACLAAGMDEFITKPITPEQLSSAIIKFSSSR